MPTEEFVAFYQHHHRLVLTVAQQRLGGVADAEDVTAEVFRIAWAHHAAGDNLTPPWLYQVLRNVVGNEYRRRLHAPEVVGEFQQDPPVEAFESITDDAIVTRRCINNLLVPEREILFMAYWEDLTRGEIAEILGCSAAAVRVRLHRAKLHLAQLLNCQAPDVNHSPTHPHTHGRQTQPPGVGHGPGRD